MNKYIGQKFNYLTIVSTKRKNNKTYYVVKCDCGNTKEVLLHNIKGNGTTKSCGCLNKRIKSTMLYKHGGSNTRIYEIYKNMKRRCLKPKSKYYHRYGGRGISICDEWLLSFENFRAWAYESGYTDELTIERIDVDKNYEPNNCKWIPWNEQWKNKTNSAARGESSFKSKLKEKEVYEIRYLLNKGYTISDISVMYKVSGGCISDIKNNKTWRHI